MPLIYCPLCEAHCGLEVDLEGGRALAVRGAVSDPDTHGFVCPKGAALAEVHNHPERLRTPLLRAADGRQRAVGWAEALGFIAERLEAVRERHGAQAVAVHVGRAGVDADFTDFARLFCFQFGSPNFSHAGSHCFMSKRMANVLTYGTLTVPDYRRSDCMLLWGYNPSASCPALASLIRRRKEEGAALVVVDPYCTPPARLADLHLQAGQEVWLVTAAPVQLASHHDYDGFYRQEMALRRRLWYPPLSELVRLIHVGPSQQAGQRVRQCPQDAEDAGDQAQRARAHPSSGISSHSTT